MILPVLAQEMFDTESTKQGSFKWKRHNGLQKNNSSQSSTNSNSYKSVSDDRMVGAEIKSNIHGFQTNETIKSLCDTMKKQIISRAFYGWLTHCRHLKTVRTHLPGLVNSKIISPTVPRDACKGLTRELWRSFCVEDGTISEPDEIRRLIYYGGCEHSIRKEVWPYLFGHYQFSFTNESKLEYHEEVTQHYEITMTEWLAVEAIVRQRDKEIMAANLAKLSSESNNSTEIMLKDVTNLTNDVFIDSFENEITEQSKNESINEESKINKKVESKRECLRRQDSLTSDSQIIQNIVITNSSVDTSKLTEKELTSEVNIEDDNLDPKVSSNCEQLSLEPNSACISPSSSNGGIYSVSLQCHQK